MPMAQMAERTLSQRPVWDLPNRGAGSASLLAPGPEDRIGPLAPRGSLRSPDRLQMPAVLAACALVAGIGTAALVRPWRRPPPRAEIVQTIRPELTPSVPPPPAIAVVPPPPPVVAATAPSERAEQPVAAKAPDRLAPATRPAPPVDAAEGAPVQSTAEDGPFRRAAGLPDRESRPAPTKQKREVRSIRRPRASVPSAEVEETGSSAAKPRPVKPSPSHVGSGRTWNLPSVLRPGGM